MDEKKKLDRGKGTEGWQRGNFYRKRTEPTCSLKFRCSAQISRTQLLVCFAISSRKELQWWRAWFFRWGYLGKEGPQKKLSLPGESLLPHNTGSAPLARATYSFYKKGIWNPRKNIVYIKQTLISHAYVCALLGTKINPWNCVLREYEWDVIGEMTEFGVECTHLLWAHLMSAVNKMSTN